MDRRRIIKPLIDGIVLDMGLAMMLPTVNRGRVGDRSLRGNHGTVYGRPAGAFDGVNDILNVSTSFDEFGGRSIAIGAFRFKADETGVDGNNLYREKWNDDVSARVEFMWDHVDNSLLAIVEAGGSGDVARLASSSPLAAGVYHTVIFAIDLVNEEVSFLIDGDAAEVVPLDDSVTQTTFAATVPNAQYIGGDMLFKGHITHAGILGTDSVPTSLDSLEFYNDPTRWIAVNCGMGYSFSEGTGTAHTDITGNGHNGVSSGMAWDLGANGGDMGLTAAGRVFDGADDYINIAEDSTLRFGTGPFQIHVWAKVSNLIATTGSFCGKGDQDGGEWNFYAQDNGTIRFYSASNIDTVTSGTDYQDDVMRLYSVIRNGNDLAILVNGISVATDSSAGGDLNDTVKPLQIGCADTHDGRMFTGTIGRAILARANKTIAQATLDALAIFARGAAA